MHRRWRRRRGQRAAARPHRDGDHEEVYFYAVQPLCFACANGRIAVMLDVCAQPGGLVKGSQCEKIKEKSNIIAARKEDKTAFDEQRAARAARDQQVFDEQLRALANVADLDEVLQSDVPDVDEPPPSIEDDITEETDTPDEVEVPDLSDVLGF